MIALSAVNAVGLSDEASAKLRKIRAQSAAATAAGELPCGIDPEPIASDYVTVEQGMSIQAHVSRSRRQLEAIAQSAISAWDGLTAPFPLPDEFVPSHA